MNNNKTICFITPTLKTGGQERVISLLANHLVSNHYKVRIITLFQFSSAYHINKEIIIDFLIDDYKSNIYNKIKILQLLTRKIKNISPSIVISFGEVFNPLSIVACRVNKIPVIISDRSNPFLKQNIFRRLIRIISYPFASGMIAQTERAKDVFTRRRNNKNIYVLTNPLKYIDNNDCNVNDKSIIHLGSLLVEKKHE